MFGFFRKGRQRTEEQAAEEAAVEDQTATDRPAGDRAADGRDGGGAAALATPESGTPPPEQAASGGDETGVETTAPDTAGPEPVAGAPLDKAESAGPTPLSATDGPKKTGWLGRLRSGLAKTRATLNTPVTELLRSHPKIDDAFYEELETILLMADVGVEATEHLLDELRRQVKKHRLADSSQVRTLLRDSLTDLIRPLEAPLEAGTKKPFVIMLAGVNGSGKTTTIGKLAHILREDHGLSVLLAAGDTFRAAAREQLVEWGRRNQVTVITQEGNDPAAVIFDAIHSAGARGIDVVLADTAGRLPTQLHLMDELRKIHRVIGKACPGAPHEVLLVLDANNGQNALAQVRAFDDALGVTGLVLTKMDGSARGGIVAAIARNRPLPIRYIGVGEAVHDLQPFRAEAFAQALLGDEARDVPPPEKDH